MTFEEAFSVVAKALTLTGTSVTEDNYDGIIVKKLESSNTLDDNRSSKQTHIAITGEQMDIFPYLRSEGYFNADVSDSDLKKYFITQIPVNIYETNVKYLAKDTSQVNINFINGIKHSLTSVIRSRREEQADQIQVSLLNFDDKDFISFRKLLHIGSYIILLKKRCIFEYDCFGIIPNIKIKEDEGLKKLNNKFYKQATNTVINISKIEKKETNLEKRLSGGNNILLYGVPGSGKSWTIENEYCANEEYIERLVFHPDYMYSDLVGQILPNVKSDGEGVKYDFVPGPFTKIMKKAYDNPMQMYYLIIEEINRGNASAIFGELFQLLDRLTSDKGIFKVGTSEYAITNENIAKIIYGEDKKEQKIRIPSNLTLLATMNSSDQNVFTLDTAFQRRWIMRMIPNTFKNHPYADKNILDTNVSWEKFCETINESILRMNSTISSEDKRLGAFFVNEDDLIMRTDEEDNMNNISIKHHNARFAEKVLKYLWDDVFKFSRSDVFNTNRYYSLEKVVEGFVSATGNDRYNVFSEEIKNLLLE